MEANLCGLASRVDLELLLAMLCDSLDRHQSCPSLGKSSLLWIHWLVVAWSLQLGYKLPKELRKQSRLNGLEVCFDSNESFFESRPTTSRRAMTAHHQSCPTVVGTQECTTGVTVGRNPYKRAIGAVRAHELKGGSALIK
jgi:hypothetical protein